MTDPAKEPTVTPEQQVVQDRVKELGLEVEAAKPPEAEPAKPIETPPAPAVVTPGAPPAPVAAPAAPALSEKELKDLRDKAGWGERSQAALESERVRATSLATENERLRRALGVPTPTEPKTVTPEDIAAKEWYRRTAAEEFVNLPAEVVASHPEFKKRDQLIFGLNDRLDQTLFLMRFPHEQQATVQRSVLPILQNQRAMTGWAKGYDELWEGYREAVKAQAQLVGIVVQPNAPAPTPAAPAAPMPPPTPQAPMVVPPSLSGVPGGPEVPKQPIQLTVEEAGVFGLR